MTKTSMREKKIRLEISSRTGRFNMLGNEETVSCHIAVYENDNKILYTNLTLEYEENPTIAYAEDAIYLLEDCFKRMFIDTSREQKEELLKFIKRYRDDLTSLTTSKRLKELLGEKLLKTWWWIGYHGLYQIDWYFQRRFDIHIGLKFNKLIKRA